MMAVTEPRSRLGIRPAGTRATALRDAEHLKAIPGLTPVSRQHPYGASTMCVKLQKSKEIALNNNRIEIGHANAWAGRGRAPPSKGCGCTDQICMPPETSIRWALTQPNSSERMPAMTVPTS